ncbi:M1 family aminopeptidase [Microlunatus ginsengisoli]|uniref:Aminopeptidase N n=1 Tax=Microlunatus ginsengisoli TaxID=363863 RepID=A0ABP6ZS84_9ACTN
MRRAAWIVVCSLVVAMAGVGSPAGAVPPRGPAPGAPGIGDAYYPLDGNGGYDVAHYDLRIAYTPSGHRLRGTAAIRATATQSLSRFDLDLHGLSVDAISVDGRRASWHRTGDELQVTPARPLAKRTDFTVVVRYHGVPGQIEDSSGIVGGVFPTADGAIVIGEPHVASTWFPVNDHPRDKASYRFQVSVPRGLEVVANGRLAGVRHGKRTTTWTWVESAPMASYLATATIGQFKLTERHADGIEFRDAIDPVLFRRTTPRTGSMFATSGAYDNAYERLSRVIDVPASGGRLSFWVTRDTEPTYDFFVVEAHPVGSDAWTTLPDLNGHTDTSTGASCPGWLAETHPFLTHYQTAAGDECVPAGTTGSWHAATGPSDGYEQWSVDLSAYRGQPVEVALSVISDPSFALSGAFVDDVTGPGGQGSTSFEADGDQLDGWTFGTAPAGDPDDTGSWSVTDHDPGTTIGENAQAVFAREPEILRFLASHLGPYPFKQAGGIVDDDPGLGYALENQTRPIYAKGFFAGPFGTDPSTVVHELAHQWTGDSVSVDRWRDIWLNEGFATYMEWLWSEEHGEGSAQDYFDAFASNIPADDPFWSVVIGDPGPDLVFDNAVYYRGAMTLQALRTRIGDEAFFRLLKRWTTLHAGGNATVGQFEALAERFSGQNLDGFFRTWLFTGEKPAGIEPVSTSARTARVSSAVDQRVIVSLKRSAGRR